MKITTCDHGSAASTPLIASLKESQAGVGRHKCAVCAFRLGLEHGKSSGLFAKRYSAVSCKHGSIAPSEPLKTVSKDQSGPHRHKCCICAYAKGFEFASSGSLSQILHAESGADAWLETVKLALVVVLPSAPSDQPKQSANIKTIAGRIQPNPKLNNWGRTTIIFESAIDRHGHDD